MFTLSVESDVSYYFAIKAVDDKGNWSGISNIVEQAWPDTIPPMAIGDLQ
jgi:hypothetical protein